MVDGLRQIDDQLSVIGSEAQEVPGERLRRGSGDVAALARSNAFLVTEPDRETWEAGDPIRVLLR